MSSPVLFCFRFFVGLAFRLQAAEHTASVSSSLCLSECSKKARPLQTAIKTLSWQTHGECRIQRVIKDPYRLAVAEPLRELDAFGRNNR